MECKVITFDCLGLFDEVINVYKNYSIIARAIENGLVEINTFNIRDYTLDKHHRVDDSPYGGGVGMVLTPQPVVDAVEKVKGRHDVPVVYLSPAGRLLNRDIAKEYAAHKRIILLCGHYEGVDQRALDMTVTDYISIGDYVLTGGEIAAVIFMDSILRFCPGVLGNEASNAEESFEDGLLEYPHYTRPEDFRGIKVPTVLLSGHHKNIAAWRAEQSAILTKKFRPDLYAKYLSEKQH